MLLEMFKITTSVGSVSHVDNGAEGLLLLMSDSWFYRRFQWKVRSFCKKFTFWDRQNCFEREIVIDAVFLVNNS